MTNPESEGDAMKLKSKILLSMGGVFLLFGIAISVALTGMQTNKSRFEAFVKQDLALAQAATNSYAQGLQMGQALRNFVMNPANQVAFKAMQTASEEFKGSTQDAVTLAASNPADLKVLEEVAALREKQAPIQASIMALATTDQAAAIEAIARDETPIWREIRKRLMDFTKAKNAAVEQTNAEMAAFSQRMLMTTLALLAVALVAAAMIVFWLVRHIMKQLGGEPGYAVEVAHAISIGDFSKSVALEKGDTTSLLYSINAMRENLTGTIGEIRTATETISVATREIATGNADLSNRTESQASSLEETASSMEELTSTVKQNAENAKQANQLVVSTAAFSARMLVWKAMPSMTPMMSAIFLELSLIEAMVSTT